MLINRLALNNHIFMSTEQNSPPFGQSLPERPWYLDHIALIHSLGITSNSITLDSGNLENNVSVKGNPDT